MVGPDTLLEVMMRKRVPETEQATQLLSNNSALRRVVNELQGALEDKLRCELSLELDVNTDFETDAETLILYIRNQPIERETMRRGIREVMDLYHPAIKESGQDMLTMIELKNAK